MGLVTTSGRTMWREQNDVCFETPEGRAVIEKILRDYCALIRLGWMQNS
ncbi:MAG: hypothetical protein KAR15_05875 [Desulfobacterales bacterium]|nr:hypothetical protein [Desulfobacterales bacterium]MCK5417386.1 hypothetical protein [Desulfobacterales bacterium]